MNCTFCDVEVRNKGFHLFVTSFDLQHVICWTCIRAFDELCQQKLSLRMAAVIDEQIEEIDQAACSAAAQEAHRIQSETDSTSAKEIITEAVKEKKRMQPTQIILIGPTVDPTQTPILTTLPPFGGPLDPNAPPFDAAFWASQPLPVQALQDYDVTNADNPEEVMQARRTAAIGLAAQGFLIDTPIMADAWGPYATMQGIRVPNGYTWTPSALQPGIPVVPGAHVPGMPDYNPDAPPVNSVPTCNNKDYYQPYKAPAGS